MNNLLSMMRGDTKVVSLTLRNEDGTPMDLSYRVVTFTAKTRLGLSDDDAEIVKTEDDGITIDDPTTGVVAITIEPADTAGFDDWRTSLQWDVQVQDGAEVRTPTRGALFVYADASVSSL